MRLCGGQHRDRPPISHCRLPKQRTATMPVMAGQAIGGIESKNAVEHPDGAGQAPLPKELDRFVRQSDDPIDGCGGRSVVQHLEHLDGVA